MARARNIKPGFYKNEDLAECSLLARYIFPGMWMLADREGRMEDRPKRIKAELLPFDDGDVDKLLSELARFGFILRYEIDGARYIQILKFSEHQAPHIREAASTIPAPDKDSASTNLGSAEASPRSPDSLIPSSLIPDSLIVGTGALPEKPAKAAPKARKPTKSPLPADFSISDAVRDWATKNRHANLQAHFDSFIGKARANGYVYVDWDQALQNAIRDDWAKLNGPQARAGPPGFQTANDKAKSLADRLTGKTRNEQPDQRIIDLNPAP